MADRIRGEVNTWSGGTEQTNPGSGAVVADTGAIAKIGSYQAYIITGASAAAEFRAEKRDAANGATVTQTIFYRAANDTAEYMIPFRVDNANERLRVVMNAALTGRSTTSIHWELVA